MTDIFQLILFRHGIAVDRNDPDCPPDHERPLTAKGVDRTRAAARGLLKLGVRPGIVLTSPLVRARETAEIAREILAPSARTTVTSALSPAADPRALFEEIDRWKEVPESVLCVGHAPHLDDLLAFALGGADISGLSLKKAGAASISIEGSVSRLLWFLDPRSLRRAGR